MSRVCGREGEGGKQGTVAGCHVCSVVFVLFAFIVIVGRLEGLAVYVEGSVEGGGREEVGAALPFSNCLSGLGCFVCVYRDID